MLEICYAKLLLVVSYRSQYLSRLDLDLCRLNLSLLIMLKCYESTTDAIIMDQ